MPKIVKYISRGFCGGRGVHANKPSGIFPQTTHGRLPDTFHPVTQILNFLVSNYTPGWREVVEVEVTCLAQEHNPTIIIILPGLEYIDLLAIKQVLFFKCTLTPNNV